MQPVQVVKRLADSDFGDWVTREGKHILLRRPLDAVQLADDPRTAAYYVESALQAHNVEFAGEPMIEGGMLVALLVPAAAPIAFDDPED